MQDYVQVMNMDHLMGYINMDEINIELNFGLNKHDYEHEINMDH